MTPRYVKFLRRVLAECERVVDRSHLPPIGYSRDPDDVRYFSSTMAHAHRFDALQRFYAVRDIFRVAEQCAVSAGDPGPFYVSARKSGKTIALEGPFKEHRCALERVPTCRERISRENLDPFHELAIGTVSCRGEVSVLWGAP